MRASSDELERLRGLKQRALALASSHLEALDVFYLAGDVQPLGSLARGPAMVGGFANVVPAANQQRNGTARASLASTAACVRSLLVCPQVKPGNADFAELVDNIVERHRSGDLSTYGLEHLNVFTLGQLLPAMADMVGSFQEPALDDLIGDAVARLQTEVAHEGVAIAMKSDPDRAEPGVLPHGYLTYWALSALATCDQHEGEYATPSLRWSETELYRQIALFQTGHDERSDAYQLGYNLLIQYRFNRFRLGDSLVELGLRMLFSAQLERGVWEKRDPIFRWEHGEAYCFSFQLLSSLLRELREDWSLLVPYEEHLARAMEWAGRNALRHHGPPLWRSAHLVEDKMPESWASAEVYTFVQLYASYLSWRIQRIVRHEFRSHPGRDPNPAAFDGLYQPEVRVAAGEPLLLGDLLRERLLEPLRVPGQAAGYSLVRNVDPRGRARSGILFGPPGTGKTTYVQRVAEYLGWPLVVLDPSVFAEEGLPLIATVASRVFAKLLELEDTVIFFDEMEALMHTRTDVGVSFEQKFLTTSLLPKLQELADRAACLFFVATNHFETIDRAAQRPGRFDFRLQIMPPSYEEKLRLARERLGPDSYQLLEADLRRQPYRENIRLASRNEMVSLCDELKRRPQQVEQILSHFRAELMDDDSFKEDDAISLV
ncbi:MAG: ATP-binding protein [Pseudonocardiaceae bacterium]